MLHHTQGTPITVACCNLSGKLSLDVTLCGVKIDIFEQDAGLAVVIALVIKLKSGIKVLPCQTHNTV